MEDTDLTARKDRLIERCLTLDDCKLAFVLEKAEKILAGEDVPDPEKDRERVLADWEAFKAEWEKAHA